MILYFSTHFICLLVDIVLVIVSLPSILFCFVSIFLLSSILHPLSFTPLLPSPYCVRTVF
jgi:hypothetical protein